ncbi:MAG: gamma-glutamylcyclotransferase family protein, partial [Pseudomonadota bacterium]
MHKTLFAYGTLLDADVRRVVLGSSMSQVSVVKASFLEHACLKLPDETYPILTEKPGEFVRGAVLHGLDDDLWKRVEFFESDEYELQRIAVTTDNGVEETWCYGAGNIMEGASETWSLANWQSLHKPQFLDMIGQY